MADAFRCYTYKRCSLCMFGHYGVGKVHLIECRSVTSSLSSHSLLRHNQACKYSWSVVKDSQCRSYGGGALTSIQSATLIGRSEEYLVLCTLVGWTPIVLLCGVVPLEDGEQSACIGTELYSNNTV